MGTIILSAFCALALNVQATEVKQDTIHKYIIDKQIVENFNGTQLEGKTISKYIIAYKNVGKTVEKTYVIDTESPTDNTTKGEKKIFIKTNSSMTFTNGVSDNYKGLVIVDGKETEAADFKKMKPESIYSVNVHKPGSKVADSYGEKGRNGVIMIVTKGNEPESSTIYFIDGQRADKQSVDSLDPTRIASININKANGSSVIEITTKK